jgi:hypothetical protein
MARLAYLIFLSAFVARRGDRIDSGSAKGVSRSFVVLSFAGVLGLLVSGCAGTPKVSQWTAPADLSLERVFDAALRAGADNNFTAVNSDRTAGLITMQKQDYAGNKMAERRMSVRLRRVDDKVVVATKVSGSDFGVIEGALGGAVHKEITNNFYVYLFRELDITSPALRRVVIEDER